jgi:hypothetical protein
VFTGKNSKTLKRKDRQYLVSRVFRVSRVILGAILFLSVLSSNIPVGVLAGEQACNLPCCTKQVTGDAGS